MKICVTGGAGFIGSHVADKYISLGHEVVIIDNLSTGKIENINPKARFINVDINSEEIHKIFETEKFDVLNHHAAQMDIRFSVNNPVFDARTNILGSINLLEAAKNVKIGKVIFSSTAGAIYGDLEELPYAENMECKPCSPYGIAKLSVEKYLFYYETVYNMPIAVLRYGNVYGPRQNPKGEAGVVAIFIDKILNGEQPVINGDGLNTREYISVYDVAEANAAALNEAFIGTYNVSTGIETNVVEIFHHLNEILNLGTKEVHGPTKLGEQRRVWCSIDKIKKEHGWQPKMTLREGLEKTVDHIKNSRNN